MTSNTMRKYHLQQRKETSSQIRERLRRQRTIEYSASLLEKALGFVRVLGLSNIPLGVKSVLDYALRRGDCTSETIKSAQLRYEQEYERNPFDKIFS